MTRRRVRVEVRDTTFVLRGWQANELANSAGVKVIYSGVSAGWLGDRHRLGDVLAYLDHRCVAYVVEDPDQGGLWPDGGDAA